MTRIKEADNMYRLVFGIISFANLAFRTINDIHSFCSSIKDAPHTVDSISIDLEILQNILQECVSLRGFEEVKDNVKLYMALESCKLKINNLHDNAKDIERGFKSKRKLQRVWAACKTPKRMEKLKDLCASLAHTKSTLQIALSVHQEYG